MKLPRSLLREALLLATVIGLMSWHLSYLAMQRFDFFDMSAFLDAGYRVYCGQEPYVDFFYLAGPVHLYMHALSFHLFGFGKSAILFHLLVVNGAVLLTGYLLARQKLSVTTSLLLIPLLSLTFYGPIAHPWYDENAAAFFLFGLLVFELTPTSARRFWSVSSAALSGALVAFSFMTKANIGLAGGFVLGAAYLVRSFETRAPWPVLAYLLGGMLGFDALLFQLESPTEFIHQNFFAFETSHRLRNWDGLIRVATRPHTLALEVCCLVLPLVAGWRFCWRRRTRVLLLEGLMATVIFMSWTGSAMVNIVLHGFVLLYLFLLSEDWRDELQVRPNGPPRWARLLPWANWGLVLLLLPMWLEMQLMVWSWNPLNDLSAYQLEVAPLRGWQCYRVMGRGVDESVVAINKHVGPDESLLVFPNCTILYALTGRESYRHAPFIFTLHSTPPMGQMEVFRRQVFSDPPQWILLYAGQEIHFCEYRSLLNWMGLYQFVQVRYKVHWQAGNFALLRLQAEAK